MRLFAAVSVIFIHVSAASLAKSVSMDDSWIMTVNKLVRFAVASFIYLAGALLWGRTRSINFVDYKNLLQNKLSKIMLPYLVWSFVYLYLGFMMNQGANARFSLKEITKSIILGGSWYHLYFIPIIAVVYLITPLAQVAVSKMPKTAILISWLLAGFTSLLLQSSVLPTISKLFSMASLYIPYAIAGACYARNKEENDKKISSSWPLLLLAGLFLNYYQNILGFGELPAVVHRLIYPIHILLVIFGLLGSSKLLSKIENISRYSSFFSSNAYQVYLSHPLLLVGFMLAVDRYSLTYLWSRPIFIIPATIFIFAGSLIFSLLLNKITAAASRFSDLVRALTRLRQSLIAKATDVLK